MFSKRRTQMQQRNETNVLSTRDYQTQQPAPAVSNLALYTAVA